MLTRSRCRRHDEHAEQAGQHELVVLVLPVVALGDVVEGHEHDHIAGQDEHGLHDEREAIDDVGPVEQHPRLARDSVDRQGDDGDHHREQADAPRRQPVNTRPRSV